MSNAIGSPSRTATGGDMRAFIETVLGDQQGNAVMALVGSRLSTGKPVVNRPSWFRYPEQTQEMVDFTLAHADEDVYISPTVYGEARDGKGLPRRAATNALTSATIYMDSDSCPPEKFRLRPSLHVQTSEHHGQDYWLLPTPIPAIEAAEIAHRITTAHKKDGTDPTGWSANKFLRMPTVNLSYAKPWPITWHETGELYDPLDISGAYDDVQLEPMPLIASMADAPDPAMAPAPSAMPEVMAVDELAPLYDRIPSTNLKLADLLQHEPRAGDKGWRSEQRWALLLELLRAGFDARETLSIAWHAMASGKWHDDPRGISGLWWELQKASAQIGMETGASVSPAERVAKKRTSLNLLMPKERESLVDRRDFIAEYVEWAATRVPVLNTPLHEINAWTLLSVANVEVGHVWKPSGPLLLNLYTISVAESSSGKTEASRLMRQVIHAIYPHDSPIIGADHSKNALVERLLERDGKVSFANSDEADSTIRTQRDSPWAQGMQQLWTEVYDGEVPQQGRIGKKDLAKPDARALVISHFIGTPQGLYDVLDREMFKSGYLVRQVWTRGVHIPVTEDSIRMARPGEEGRKRDHTLLPRYWARRIAASRMRVMGPNAIARDVHFTNEAADRIDKARWRITQELDKLGDEDIYRPMRNRMLDTLSKACALIALDQGRTYVTTKDAVLAISYVQRWLETAIEVVDGIAASAFSRACDEIEAYLLGREGNEAEASKVYGLMRDRKPREVDEFVQSLINQGRVEAIQPPNGGPRRFRVKGL